MNKKVARICAGLVVGGIASVGAMSVSGAGLPVPVQIGSKYYGPGGAVNVLNTYAPTPQLLKATQQPVGTVQVGGSDDIYNNNGSLGGFLADPLPVDICVLCHPDYESE